jgi:HD-GYP domain-containing protein (c-di-GMP phosphodiesterase class II)
MDAHLIAAPVVNDRGALLDFIEALSEHAPKVEHNLMRLKSALDDRDALSDLFRIMHNIKGDAAMSRVDVAVVIAHPIETVLARFRSNEIALSDCVVDAILLAIDRLELLAEGLAMGQALESLRLLQLVQHLEIMAQASAAEIDACARVLIEAVTGFRPAAAAAATAAPGRTQAQLAEDLRFFRTLANQFEARSPLFKGRTTRILRLAQETNQAAGNKIDAMQLEAASYLHDIGMMFLPDPVWIKDDRMTPNEKLSLRMHPEHAAGMLSRMEGWSPAADMVMQHHEMPNGGGYPKGLTATQICDGAKLLAIIDAFEAVMLTHIHRGKNRSVLRAIAEINACDTQFASEWIGPFNQVIRRTVET